MPVSFAFAYAHPLHSVIDKGEHEKYLFLQLDGNTENSLVTARSPDQLVTVKRQKGN